MHLRGAVFARTEGDRACHRLPIGGAAMYRTNVLSQFDELGYAVLENVLDPEQDLAPLIQD
jgi:hypothetical protein